MALSFYYIDFWGNKCWVESSSVSKASDGCWYDQKGHKCHSTLDGTVEGSSGNDVIDAAYTGDPEGDRIDANDAILGAAKSNDDIVHAYGGNDKVVAGEGNDTVYGGEGNDQLFGGNGHDALYGDAGNDTLSGGAGSNALYGGAGDDRFIGGAGADTLYGGAGQDNVDYSASTGGVTVDLSAGTMAGGDAANDVNGGGIDGVIGSNQADSLTGFDGQGSGADSFTNQFWGNGGNDTISGLGGNDLIYGGADADQLYGGTGDDFVAGDQGNDLVEGGAGNDTLYGDLSVAASGSPVTITLTGDGGAYDCKLFVYSIDPRTGAISNIQLLNSDTDLGIGTRYSYNVAPGTVVGVGIVSPDGTYYSSAYGSRLGLNNDGLVHTKGLGVDANGAVNIGFEDMKGLGDKDFDDVRVKVDLGTSGASFDNAHYTYASTLPQEAGAGADTIIGGDGNDLIYGGAGNDQLFGGKDDDTIQGGSGDDTLSGGAGKNVLSGGDDRDLFLGGAVGDRVDGGEGGNDQDTLDLRGLGPVRIVYDAANPENGTVEFLDAWGGAVTGTMSFVNIETVLKDAPVRDGYVDGTAGNDLIDAAYAGDPQGDRVDGNDALLPGAQPNDDVIRAGAGDDTVRAGLGHDLVYGGTGDDSLEGGAGDDTLFGGAGRDSLIGGEGNDLLDSSGTGAPDIAMPGTAADADPNDDRDLIDAGAGDDTIRSGDDADTVYGGAGRDSIDGGDDADLIDAGAENDTVFGGEGSDTIEGGLGDDLIYGGMPGLPDATDPAPGNDRDLLRGGAGNDTLYGMDDRDTLFGGSDNDVLYGGIDDDRLFGGTGNDQLYGDQGNDTLQGDAGADSLFGGDDRDTFTGLGAGDSIDGGEGGDDVDTLDLSGAGPLRILYDSANPEKGTVEFLDADRHVTGSLTFQNIENVIPCFTPGTRIATPRGEVAVESLRPGDRIITRDNGMQEIAWVGRRNLSSADLKVAGHLKPVLVRAGALGHGLPERDMLVSPNHRLLVANDRTALYFDEHEVLVAAKHLTGVRGVSAVEAVGVSYIHFMCARHEVVLSDGAWTETFQPGDQTLKGMGNAQRSEIYDLFPELKTDSGLETYRAVRKTLKRHEAALLWR